MVFEFSSVLNSILRSIADVYFTGANIGESSFKIVKAGVHAFLQVEATQIGVTIDKNYYLSPLRILSLFLISHFGISQSVENIARIVPNQKQAIAIDYLSEGAGANHTFGYFFLDIDTDKDGLPDFFETGPADDLDGDGLAIAKSLVSKEDIFSSMFFSSKSFTRSLFSFWTFPDPGNI